MKKTEVCFRCQTVIVGELGAVGPNPDANGKLTEDCDPNPVSDYGRSKLAGEAVVKEYESKIPYTILRLSAVYGSRDSNFYKFFKSSRNGVFPELGSKDKELTLAHASDIVDGMVKAAFTEKSPTQTYFLASRDIYSFQDIRKAIEKARGQKLKHLKIPDWFVSLMMIWSDLLSFFGKDILLNRDRLATLTHPRWVVDISKAENDLGFQQNRSLEDGFKEAYEWYVKEGWL